jgi:predicted transposase YdaD
MSKNNDYIVKHPHDTFFKKTFSKKEIAEDFLKNYLPEEILHDCMNSGTVLLVSL